MLPVHAMTSGSGGRRLRFCINTPTIDGVGNPTNDDMIPLLFDITNNIVQVSAIDIDDICLGQTVLDVVFDNIPITNNSFEILTQELEITAQITNNNADLTVETSYPTAGVSLTFMAQSGLGCTGFCDPDPQN